MSDNLQSKRGPFTIKHLGAQRPIVSGEMVYDPKNFVWKGNDDILAIFKRSKLNLITKKDYQTFPEKLKMNHVISNEPQSLENLDMVFDEKTNKWRGNEEILLEFETSEEISPAMNRGSKAVTLTSSGSCGSPMDHRITKVKVRKPNPLEGGKSILDKFKESLEEDEFKAALAPEEEALPPKQQQGQHGNDAQLSSSSSLSKQPTEEDWEKDVQIPLEPDWNIRSFKLVQQDEENWYFELNEEKNKGKVEEWSEDIEVPNDVKLELKEKPWAHSSVEEEPWNDVDVNKLGSK